MLRLLQILIILSLSLMAESDYAYQKIFDLAKKDRKWSKCRTLTERMWLIRSYAAKEPVVSSEVSDRYQITCYGGPIDLVHFLALSAYVGSGRVNWEARLYKEWVAEGGPDHVNGFDLEKKQEAHPDDLPSNAFGALWGSELKDKNRDLSVDLEKSFSQFISTLKPVPRKISQEFSHRQIVMGLPKNPTLTQIAEKYAWYQAIPFTQCKEINRVSQKHFQKDFCKEFKTHYEALLFAGFLIERYKGKAIIIRRF